MSARRHEWARDPDERYGIYLAPKPRPVPGHRVREEEPELLATCAQDGIGVALVTLAAEKQITSDDRVGVLDGIAGTWLVNPYARGRSGR